MDRRVLHRTKATGKIEEITPLSIQGLRQAILDLPTRQPVTDRLERDKERGTKYGRVWYGSQKEHWLGWLFHYEGPGFYGRQRWDRTAEFVYNHINCAPMVLWLVEASGVDTALVRRASRSIVAGNSGPTQCSVVRRVVPWEVVEAALLRRQRDHWGRG